VQSPVGVPGGQTFSPQPFAKNNCSFDGVFYERIRIPSNPGKEILSCLSAASVWLRFSSEGRPHMHLASKIASWQFGFVWLAAVAFLGVLLTLQGWKSRTPSFDMMTTIESSDAFLTDGTVPDRGVLTSFGSYAPPGITWFMIPGLIVFDDPRLFEYIGSIAFYVGTLAGIFLLGRTYLGSGAAFLSVALYGLSELGISAAGSLWQRYPMHFFYVWMVFFLGKWVAQQNATFLAAALLVWGIGMYVFLEIAPAIMIIPVVWFLYRPPLRFRPLVAFGVVAAVILVWYPYLKFESGRGYVDLQSQVSRRSIVPANFQQTWCDPSLRPATWGRNSTGAEEQRPPTPRSSFSNARNWISERAGLATTVFLISNFRTGARVSGVAAALLALTFVGMFSLSFPHRKGTEVKRVQIKWKNRLGFCGAGAVVCGFLLNEWMLARLLSSDGVLSPSAITAIRIVQAVLVIGGTLLITARTSLSAFLARLTTTPAMSPYVAILPVSLAIPWFVLILISDAERPERFWSVWPLQILILASVATSLAGRIQIPNVLMWVGSLTLFFALAANSIVIDRVDGWAKAGWSGEDSIEILLADYIGDRVRGQGRSDAKIGYDIFTYQFPATFHPVDPRYKIGADLDSQLKHRKNVTNSNRCAEGFAPGDAFRVVQTYATHSQLPGLYRLPVAAESDLVPTRTFGPFQVFERLP